MSLIHLLLYVVYTCQKLFNFINAFACYHERSSLQVLYKEKCKLAPFNLAHPVHAKFHRPSGLAALRPVYSDTTQLDVELS